MRKILLIDDNDQDRVLYRRFLTKAGAGPLEFGEAVSGAEAVARFRAMRPDCVLLDQRLPDTDGLTLLRELQRLAPPDGLCVVMITGVGSESLAVQALTAGALDYLVKQQFDADLLYRTVCHAIERSEARRQLARSHAELLAANTALAHANADLDNFIYAASHDLRGPLLNLEGLLTALTEELAVPCPPPDLVEPLVSRMQNSLERFKKTLDHLSDTVQFQQAQGPPPVPVDLNALVQDLRLDLTPLLRAAQGELEVELAACPVISFSPKNLRSIVYNLLTNALKYRHPDRPARVRLCCTLEAGAPVLVVQDNGLGLALNTRRPLFTLFTRFHSHVEGTGIGLYMVKKMVEQAGGRVEVQSEIGAGSTFTVYFRPAANPAAAEQ